MPTKKQRRRVLKERRHEYETVWVDGDGNDLDDPPEEAAAPEKRDTAKRDGAKAKPKAKAGQKRGNRPVRVPPEPSWRRAVKRGGIFGVVVFAVFAVLGSKNGAHAYGTALVFGGVYTLVFIPFTFYIDRFSYNRWQRRAGQQGQKSARKR